MPEMIKRILSALVLPTRISAFEDGYVRRMNRIALGFFALHVPVFIAIAWFNDTGPGTALVLTSAVLAGPAVAHLLLDNPRWTSVVHGVCGMFMGGLLVHFGQGPVQIEMHFYFFALIAMLALFGNPAVVVAAAVTVAAHHLVLWYYLPSSVFNYDAPLWVVLIHALFVVLESVGTVFIARSFFDNVIGLEQIVDQRTQQLDARNRDMRLVLDNVDQGLLIVDPQGVIVGETSAAVERWFGPLVPRQTFSDYIEHVSPRAALAFSVAFDQLCAGLLPTDVALDQFPTRMDDEQRHFSLSYIPIQVGDALSQMLVVISDVTHEVKRQHLEAEQREAMRIFDRILSDRAGFIEFFEEAESLIDELSSPSATDLPRIKRLLHTLKGNALLFGVESVSDRCHRLESQVDEEGTLPSATEFGDLVDAWARLKVRLSTVIDPESGRQIEISSDEYQRLLAAALRTPSGPELASMLVELRLEPTSRRLERVGAQAKRMARRLGKGDIEVRVDDGNLRIEPRRWAGFWSAFVHVVRNAIDHGLEAPEERTQRGKSSPGMLRLATMVEHDDFVVRLEDDGRGIDWASVRERAAKLGIPATTQEELEQALFSQGLSTAHDVTDFSGRGVGMGAVLAACKAHGGTVHISSRSGVGTQLEFRFPREAMAPSARDFLAAAA